MRNNKTVLETTHRLCKTDMINMNDIQLLNTSESFAPDFWCHVEYKIILYCYGSRMVNEKLSFISMLLINCQLRQIISAVFQFITTLYLFFYIPHCHSIYAFYSLLKYRFHNQNAHVFRVLGIQKLRIVKKETRHIYRSFINLYLAYKIGLHHDMLLFKQMMRAILLSIMSQSSFRPPAAQYVIDAQNEPMYMLSYMKG